MTDPLTKSAPILPATRSVDGSNKVVVARSTLSLSARRGAVEARSAPLSSAPASSALANETVPLKRLTAGRKSLKIAHAGETYLLRVTKANKLILTKPAVEPAPPKDKTGGKV